MTEKDILNATVTSEESDKNSVATIEEVQPEKKEEKKSSNRSSRKQSNLRGRWKRNQMAAGIATIKEDDAKLPKEIKTVKISTAESINTTSQSNDYKRQRPERKSMRGPKKSVSEEKKEKCPEQKCFCTSFLGKVKCFVLKLFGFKLKKCCGSQKSKNFRGRSYSKRPYRGRPHHK